jgi:S1-C subfamily serine protease
VIRWLTSKQRNLEEVYEMKVKSCVIFIAVTCSFLSAQQPKQNTISNREGSLPDIIDSVRPSIAKISVSYTFKSNEQPDQEGSYVSGGTGFVLDSQGHIATAGHVVSLDEALKTATQMLLKQGMHINQSTFVLKEIGLSFPAPSSENVYNVTDSFAARVLVEDDQIDLAVLICEHNPVGFPSGGWINGKPVREAAKVPKVQLLPPRDGDMISVSGFPLGIPVLVTNTGWIASSLYRDEKHRSVYLGSLLANHGDSGGPAYVDSDGSIIGVVTEYRPAPEGNSGLAVIIPMKRVFDLLATVK